MAFQTSVSPKTGKHAFRGEVLLWQISLRLFIEPSANQNLFSYLFLLIQTPENCCQWQNQKLLHESGVQHRHLVAGFENNGARGSRFERVGSQNFFRNRQISSEPSATSCTCLWDPNAPLGQKKHQKHQHRNPLKNGSLSEHVMKEGERVLFQPLQWKSNRTGLRCGHFATLTDPIGPF